MKDERMVRQLTTIAEWFVREPRLKGGTFSNFGTRLGGRLAFLLAARKPELVSACVALHPLSLVSALDFASGLKAPLRLIYAGSDDSVSKDAIDRIRAQLDHLGKEYVLEILPDATRDFMLPTEAFDAEQSEQTFAATLEWLAKQPEPRIWISDGGVTGKHDTPSRSLKTRCATICRRSNIQRVDGVTAAAKLLATGR